MTVVIQLKRGSGAPPLLADGEPGWDHTNHVLYVGDGATNTAIGGGYTNEQAQDAVGGILTDTATVDLTYDDAANTITADVVAGSIGPTQLASTAVTPGSYTLASITVDAQGRLTAASNGSSSATLADGDYTDVTVSGSGTVIEINPSAVGNTELAPDAVSNAKLANMATATLKGRNTAGTGDPEDLPVTTVTAMLNAFVASGTGHLKGLVPDPGASAGTTKFLREDATWAVPSGGSGTVTSFSAGDLSPLFTTSEATVTTTPALTFTLNTQSANALFAGPTSGAAAAPTFRAMVAADVPDGLITEAKQTLADNTTGNVTSTKHGYAPKSPADATKFLNGATTPDYALVKDSDLSTSDVTTNNVSTTKHGFAPKAPNDATQFLNGVGGYAVPPGSVSLDNMIVLTDTKSSGTAGGTFTSGANRTRDLNNEQHDGPNCCTLSGNQFTLAAGTYLIHARAPAFYVDSHKARLQNVTDNITLPGTSEYSGVGTAYSVTASEVIGVFTIASSKTFELQHQCQTTNTTFGWGNPSSFSGSEIYSIVILWKIS